LAEPPSVQDAYCEGVIPHALRALWHEPRAENAPKRVWRDWLLVGVVVLAAVLEGAFRPDVLWRPIAIALALLLVWPLLWRRTHPLATVAIVFGAVSALSIASLVEDVGPLGLYTTGYILVVAYSLFRWGSGREIILGLPLLLVTYGLGIAADYTGVGDAIAAAVFALSPSLLGALVRYQSSYQRNEREQVRLREREQLARELHDTVAHHVSAIAVRAQAGRVVAATDPEAVLDSLTLIEAEASRALTEMRLMVGALRDGEQAELAPLHGVADIRKLALADGASPQVSVQLTGALDDLGPSIEAALYRLAQESVTNALRHAKHATRIDIIIDGDAHQVQLTVVDDGDALQPTQTWSGYGLVGMSERAALLGGNLQAGPRAHGGWEVNAVMPKDGPRT
jgi:signal transduction histidine kinase